MADKRDQWSDSFSAEPQGWLTGFLADEDKGGRRLMWRLGTWGVLAVAAVTVAILSSQSQVQWRREQFAASDAMVRQSQQIQQLTREAQAENRRLVQAIETLNGDRDRLYTRVTSVEKNLESVTGSILVRQTPPIGPREPAPQIAAPISLPAPAASAEVAAPPELPPIPVKPPVGETIAAKPAEPAPVVEDKAEQAPSQQYGPEPPVQVAAVSPPVEIATPVTRTEFGIDIGGANSVDGLRAVWRGIAKLPAMAGLRPIIMVKERSNGLGMQLRLVAGPLTDAAAAARICATLAEGKRSCETSVFDGQRLALKNEPSRAAEPAVTSAIPAAKPQRPPHLRRVAPKPEPVAAPAPAPKPEQRSEQPLPRQVEEAQAQAPVPAPPAAKPSPSLGAWLGLSREDKTP